MHPSAKIGHLSLVVTAGMVAAGTASATLISTGTGGSPYTGSILGSNLTDVFISSSSTPGTITCKSGSLSGSVGGPNPNPGGGVSTPMSSGSLGTCSSATAGSCSASPTGMTWSGVTTWAGVLGGRDATLGLAPPGVSFTCGTLTCNYSTTSTTSDAYNGTNAARPILGSSLFEVSINASMVKQSGSGFGCAGSANWIGTYGFIASGVGPIVATEL